jgi:transcriptional regulator with XRE-family HTH domain
MQIVCDLLTTYLFLNIVFYVVLLFNTNRMSFGSRLLEARKRKGLSQEDIARHLGTKGPAIGRYERDEMKPSIEVAAKMASYLDVSLDFLVGASDEQMDRSTMTRVLELQKLPEDIKDKLYYFIDMTIRDFKAKKAYS